MINLNPEWTELLHSYKREHQDPRNRYMARSNLVLRG